MEVVGGRTRLVGILYAVLWGPLWLLYEKLSHGYALQLTGNIPAAFWIIALLYLAVDVALVLGLNLLGRSVSKEKVNEPFWHLVSEIVPVWFLIHLLFVVIGHPVSDRLEVVGLGDVEVAVGATTLVAAVGFIIRGVARDRSETKYWKYGDRRVECTPELRQRN